MTKPRLFELNIVSDYSWQSNKAVLSFVEEPASLNAFYYVYFSWTLRLQWNYKNSALLGKFLKEQIYFLSYYLSVME